MKELIQNTQFEIGDMVVRIDGRKPFPKTDHTGKIINKADTHFVVRWANGAIAFCRADIIKRAKKGMLE